MHERVPARARDPQAEPAQDRPPAARILQLHQSAGNAAVARAILARQTRYPEGKDLDSGYWGHRGQGIPTDELATKIVTDLLRDPQYAAAAPEVLNGYWIVHIVEAVEHIRQAGALDQLAAVSGSATRVRLAIALVRDPATFDAERQLAGVSDQEYADLTGARRDGTPAPGAPAHPQVAELRELRIPLALEQFATRRAAKFQELRAGEPAPAVTQPDNSPRPGRELEEMLRWDATNLPPLETLTATRGGERWAHPKHAVTEAILAALQLRAVGGAMAQLERGEGATHDVHEEARAGTGWGEMINWCGMFASQMLAGGGMDRDLRGGMDSTSKVYAFFTYGEGHPDVVRKYIRTPDGGLQTLRDYHETARNSRRNWIPTASIGADGLDIRPGDVLTLAVANEKNTEKAFGDHIVLVHSYDRATKRLFTIGGNDGGYVVRNGAPPARESATDRADRERREAATGERLQRPTRGAHVGVGSQDLGHQPTPGRRGTIVQQTHVAGIGRPSIVDFEDHVYPSNAAAEREL
ncbi:hypothetical protein, partial [Solirubrobacter deserti]